ncbi:Kip1 ubiquitination-promoting complex subunit 2 [Carabus blaptoides fortunei]
MNEVDEIVSNLLEDIITDVIDNKKKKANNVQLLVGSVFWDGNWMFDMTKVSFISRIKRLALFELNGTESEMQVNQYMLIFPLEKRPLHDNKTIKDERLKDNDELELIKLPPSEDFFLHFTHRLTPASIASATKDLPKPVQKPNLSNIGLDIQSPEFMSDLRKIMISLIEYSLMLMSIKPNAKCIFDKIRRKLMAENFFIDDKMIAKYKSTGATVRRIKFAVNASYDNSFSVNAWLTETKSIDSVRLGVPINFQVDAATSVEKELEELLTLFHQYLCASFKICPKSEETMKEMGFEEDEIYTALRFTGNNVSESVEYIVGSTDPQNGGAKPGLSNGMSPTSDMHKVIMADSEIITPLQNPNVLYACLSVIDANSFFVPSVKCPGFMHLLNKILTTYYINKCDFVMHQMLGHEVHD